jgi:hypothetical protein
MSRKSFSIKEKNELIKECDRSALNQKDFAASKNISASTLRTILKKRSEFVSTREGTGRKKIRSAKYEELETILKNWFIQARRSHVSISGPILQERARQVANSLGIADFTASTGWLDRFKTRHSLIYKKQICGESKSVNPDLPTDWKNQISALTSGYESSEIYNAREFGLFFTTSDFQGIIKVLKQGYRRRIVQQYLSMMDSSTPPKISVLDAIHFLYGAWMDVKKETILNCFKKAGVGNFTGRQETEEVSFFLHIFIVTSFFHSFGLIIDE